MKHACSRNRRATALVVALWLSLGLAATVLVFGQNAMLEYRASAYVLDRAQAGEAADGVRRWLSAALRDLEEPGRMPEEEAFDFVEIPIGDATCWLIGRDADDGLPEGDAPAWGLVDEASKLNLNTATREMLEALPGMTAELAAAVVDWRDEDSDLTEGGAESQDYLLLDPGYACKNAPFETVEELRLVRGFDREMLFGEDANLNGVLDPNENDGDASAPADDADGVLDEGLLAFVTVWSREPNKNPDGEARVDVSDESQDDALEEVLAGVLGADGARDAVRRAGDLQQIGSVLEFYLRAGIGLDDGAELDGLLTVGGDAYRPGLVNINTAPREVLAALPGIGEESADAVVAWRSQRTADALTSVRWLAEAIDEAAARQAGPYVTTQSWQFSADVAALGEHGRGLRRTLYVIDLAETTDADEANEAAEPFVAFREDRTALGWPFGAELREEVGSQTWRKERRDNG